MGVRSMFGFRKMTGGASSNLGTRKSRATSSFRWVMALARLSADSSAIAAIEFAIVVPVFLILVVETMQLGYYFYASAALSRATTAAAREILTGSVTNQGLTAAQFRTQILCPLLPGSMSCANIVTNVQTVPEATSPGGFYAFVNAAKNGLTQPAMDNARTSYCPGAPGSYVVVQVYFAMPVMSPIWVAMATSWNGGLVHFVSAVAAFKNEPFPATSQIGC
jgi:Flp pilus assembly protein TadG